MTQQMKDCLVVSRTMADHRLGYVADRHLPNFGVGLKKLLFEQNINLESLKQKIITQADFYVPNIQVFNVQTSLSTNQRTLFVSVTYRSLLDNTVDAIQLNFNE